MPTTTVHVDLTDDPRVLSGWTMSDVLHRAGFPRGSVAAAFDDTVVSLMTRYAAVLADTRCGIAPDTPSGPAEGSVAARGSLRWFRHYIAELDRAADALFPGWRTEPRNAAPYPWTEEAFGSISPHGRSLVGSPPRPNGRPVEEPSVVGRWTFDLPSVRD